MGIKTYNPYTPSRRQMTGSDFSEITKTTPEKSLLDSKKRNTEQSYKKYISSTDDRQKCCNHQKDTTDQSCLKHLYLLLLDPAISAVSLIIFLNCLN